MTAPSEPDASRRRTRRFFRRYLAVLVAPLAGILLALALGAPTERLWRAVEFQVVALAAAIYFLVALRVRARTTKRQRTLKSLVGIRFTMPLWMMLMESSIPIEIGGAIAAVTATLGFVAVGNGVFLVFVLIASGLPWLTTSMRPRSIVFELSGVRFSVARATFLVPWASIVRVEPVGRDHFVALNVILKNSESILASAEPPGVATRDRIKTLIQPSDSGDAHMFLTPWVAGLDGRTLEGAIRAGIRGTAPEMN